MFKILWSFFDWTPIKQGYGTKYQVQFDRTTFYLESFCSHVHPLECKINKNAYYTTLYIQAALKSNLVFVNILTF